jgi:hypothetical protein
MQVLTAASYLRDIELDCLKLISLFSKLFLQSGCNLVEISSLLPEKSDDHFLITVHPKRTFSGFQGPDRENHFLKAIQLNSI